MLSAREVGLTAQRELRRNLQSTKGIAMIAVFFLCGLVPSVVRVMLARAVSSSGLDDVPEVVKKELFQQGLSKLYESKAVVDYLANSPPVIYFLFAGTLTFLPLFILPIGFDQIAGEIQNRTIRYSAGRGERASLVVGKALGVWGVIAAMVGILHVTVWVIALAQGGQSFVHILSWGGRFYLFSVICAASYVGFISLMSSFFKTPIVALFVGAGTGFALWLAYKILSFFPSTQAIGWAFPNRYEQLVVSPDPLHVLGGLALFVAWGGLCVAGAAAIVARRDI
jgi:ABC-type transport system involved in multi-copper enzyme maturation permease subunit